MGNPIPGGSNIGNRSGNASFGSRHVDRWGAAFGSDAAKLAATKAVLPLAGTVVASDAFFPFRDGIDVIAGAGATAIIQPGGSVKDEEVVAAADEHGLAMVLTGVRHFRH